EAVILTHMIVMGIPYNMVLRSAGDRARPETTPVTLQYILDSYNITVPARTNVTVAVGVTSLREMISPEN
ncbi:MAG TPA: hypothetical protein PLZ51_07325, partial [Aggregatilineales bacterium]|nr:hypothetical protein [Aggregatilineales bacterium]